MPILKFQITQKLLSTPLFLGLSRSDLKEIVGNTKFGFDKYKRGEIIANVNDSCYSMLFLLDGKIEVTTTSADHSYSITELISAPLQIQPERLFGLHQVYTSTFTAKTVCNTMKLHKTEVINLYNNYQVFRINLLNNLATSVQKAEDRNWMSTRNSLRMRIVHFVTRHCLRPAGEKTIKIKMNCLAEELNDSRINISKELNKMQTERLISLSRGVIHIPALEHLYM